MNLDDKVTTLPKVGPFFANKLEKLGIFTIEDLFYHVPSRYEDYSNVTKIKSLKAGETATIHAKVNSITNVFSKRGVRMQIGAVEDETGKLMVVWFNQPFLIKTFYPGRLLSLSGKVGFFNRKVCLSSPDYEILDTEDAETVHTGRLVPIYPETDGLSSKWLRTKIKNIFPLVNINDYLSRELLDKYNLEGLRTAFYEVHFPKDEKDTVKGRERLAFDEVLKLQLQSEFRRNKWRENKVNHKLKIDKEMIQKFSESLPFVLTNSQKTAVDEIMKDMAGDIPMNRLLEGDVGSGKTAVAASGIFAAFVNGYQSMLMAPTQILAAQHYETLKKIFDKFNIRISLLTSDVKKLELGRSDVFVGTHSLIHSKLDFKNVAYIVIDEQHRFGVEQRQHLVKKSGIPHVLTMTATPIPRTVALTSFGDLDLSILNEMPKGRLKITTWVVAEKKREGAYEWIKKQIKDSKSQIFIVCPLIEDSESETLQDVKSVTTEFQRLKKIFPDFRSELLHGRLKPAEKAKVLENFRQGKTDVLVSTPVVEVGIDIPNATVMVIEAAERFGLAQLHQLRGRVGRGSKASYCLLFSNFHSGMSYTRLKAMEKTHSGFELAELDLKLRGPGEIFGTRQSGFEGLKVASWNNFELIKKAKDFATVVMANPKDYPNLLAKSRFDPI